MLKLVARFGMMALRYSSEIDELSQPPGLLFKFPTYKIVYSACTDYSVPAKKFNQTPKVARLTSEIDFLQVHTSTECSGEIGRAHV